MNKCKRFLALLLVLCMMLSVVPFSAFAAEDSDETTDGESQNVTVETVAEETTAEETTGETTVEETTEETTVEETTEETTVEETTEETTVEETTEETTAEEDMMLVEGIASFALTREAVGYSLTMGTKPADGTTTGNPFVKGTGGSNSFRIPAMVTLNNGTIVAAADARWNTTYDGGGLDTIVSYSTDNGANWNYTFANYLGDNGNEYNGSGSTAFIDPALATDGSAVYMLCDLYPYGVALNGSGNTAPSTDVGFNSDGKLLLSNDNHSSYGYYLDGDKIYSSAGTPVDGLTVNAYFNVTGTYNETEYNTNLFFSDSPFKVVRTGYLYLTKSTDGGKNWSAPTLIPNVKTSSEQVCLVGPGRGLVTGGKIIFPVYSYNNGDQQMGFIYSENHGATWTRSANFTGASWSSEAAVVALSDGTLRFFYRNGTSALCYVDYSWTTNSWGSAVNTGIATNSNTQISAISYSKTVDGKQVILVSCPTGASEAGSNSSSGSARLNGKIFVGYVNSDNTISWQSDKAISVTSNNSQFMYSCLTELKDGKVAILYENQESSWGTGDNCYYTMDFQTYDLGLTAPATVTDETTNVSASAMGLTSVSAEKLSSSTTYTGYTASVTYSITLNDGNYTSSAEIKIPYDDTFVGCTDFIGTVTNTENTDTFPVELVNGYFVGTVPHFSDVTISGRALTIKNVELQIGKSQTFTDTTGNYAGNYTAPDPANIATMDVTGSDGQEGGVDYTQASVTCNTLIDSNSNSWTAASGYYYKTGDGNYYPVYAKRSSSRKLFQGTTYTYTWGYSTTSSTSNVNKIGTQSTTSTSTTPNITVYTQSTAEAIPASTTITFTGVSAGETTAVVGSTQYNITVTRKTETVNLTVDNTATYTDSSSKVTVADSSVASATLSNGTLTITGLKDGTTKVTTDTTIYTVTVSDGTSISIKENETTTISVTLEDGQYVKWSSADSNYVGVAGKYDTTAKAYTNEAILAGQNVTSSPVPVTGTVYNADGTVAGTYKWLVTVTEGDADKNTSSKGIYFNIATIENCTVYYSINGGELIPVNGTGVTTGNWTENGIYKGHFNIMFFAAPDDGYALTYMSISGSADQYYTLANGNPDGTGSDAWPFKDANASTIPSGSGDSAWKTVDGKLHGFRWSLLEGNMTIEQMKVLFSNAIALGCDGATTITKNGNEGMGSASSPTVCKFVAQKLPTVDKSITSITRGTETITNLNGFKVKIGDTINYSVVVTRYATNATYGTITYDNEELTDKLTKNNGISNPDMGTSTTADQTYTYNTSITLTKENFGTVVTGGTITNEAEFKYTYKSQYSTGSIDAKSSAVVEVTVEIPSYVVDFGLPVEINLTGSTSGVGRIVSCKDGQYGTAALNGDGTGFTYTPTEIMQGVDYVEFTYHHNDDTTDYTYRVAIYPATTVYYEEGFATYSGSWTEMGNKGTGTQTTQIAGRSSDEYGYDDAYVTDVTVGPSNGTQATTSTKGATADFSFTGTGVDIYANCATNTGWLMIHVKNANGSTVKVVTVKLLQVNTALENGDTEATLGQNVTGYNVPVASITGLAHGNYSVTITNVYNTIVNLDGIRVYGTLATEPDFYKDDLEDTPTFIELRDQVLAGLSVSPTDSDQVYAGGAIPEGAKVTVVASSGNYTQAQVDDLLTNGPKNEIYLQKNQALVLKITTAREVQIGLKALNKATTYTINNESKFISTSTDMFYTVSNKGTSGEQTITITNNGEGILSVTKLKVCDDPNAALAPLTWDDLANALDALGIRREPNDSKPTEPTEPIDPKPTDPEPSEPEVTYADATLTVSLVDYTGKQVASVDLTANGVEGETKAFTAEEVLAAAKANVPEGYVLVDESKVTGAEVAYGESGKLTVQIGKTATLKVIYVNLRGKNVGTAAITKVQTSAGNCKIAASEIRANAPAGRRAVWLTNVRIPYGSERSIIVPVI